MDVRILIADDETPILELLSEFITKLGYVADTAQDVDSAIDLLKANTYDIVLRLDYDGYDFTDEQTVAEDVASMPRLAAAAGTGHVAVAWTSSDRSGSVREDVHVTRATATGGSWTLVDATIASVQASGRPSVAWAESAYAVAWDDDTADRPGDYTDIDVYFARVWGC